MSTQPSLVHLSQAENGIIELVEVAPLCLRFGECFATVSRPGRVLYSERGANRDFSMSASTNPKPQRARWRRLFQLSLRSLLLLLLALGIWLGLVFNRVRQQRA